MSVAVLVLGEAALVVILVSTFAWAYGEGLDVEQSTSFTAALWKLWVLFAGLLLAVVCVMELALWLVVG